ncbi:MAG: hypothetical protein AB7S65_07310 [Sulfuricurvum sp.]
MTIDSSSWLSSLYSSNYSNGSVQSSSGASGMGGAQSSSGASGQASSPDYTQVLQQAVSGLMSALDTNNDSTISQSELAQGLQSLSQNTSTSYDAQSAFKILDSNGNGSVTSGELLDALQQSRGQNTQNSNNTASNMQDVLLQRILSAYQNSADSISTGSSTLLTA